MYQHWESVEEFLNKEMQRKDYGGSKLRLLAQLSSARFQKQLAWLRT